MNYGFRWIDTSDPLRWCCVLPAQYSVEEFSAEFDLAHSVISGLPDQYRFVYLADFSLVQASDPRNRARVARFLSECAGPVKRNMIAWGIVAPKALMRGAITAVGWLGTFPIPTRVFAEDRECRDWLDQQLARDQLLHEDSKANQRT